MAEQKAAARKPVAVAEFVTVAQLAEELGYSIQHVADLVRDGRVHATRGRRRRYLFTPKEADQVRKILSHAENSGSARA